MIEIDGSYREGGGQIIRTALALSALTGKAFHTVRIRQGRKDPGLKTQHMTGALAMQQLCGAHLKGATKGSTELTCEPGPLTGGHVFAHMDTAGSLTLLLQSLLLPCSLAPDGVDLSMKGGTNVSWAPPWDYFEHVILPFARRLADIDFEVQRHGFHPKGDAVIRGRFRKSNTVAQPLDLVQRGDILRIRGRSVASSDLADRRVAERQAEGAASVLEKKYKALHIATEYFDTPSTGTAIVLWAETSGGAILGADLLGQRRIPAENVGRSAAQQLVLRLRTEACVDEHLADNLIPIIALCGGRMRVELLSEHLHTNIYVVEKFLDVCFEFQDNIISVRPT